MNLERVSLTMLEKLNVKGFRKYNDFTVFDLANVNIVLGDNNVGKTSFLEAVYVWCCGCNAGSFVNIPLSRGRYGFIQQPFWVMEELLSAVNDAQNVPMKMSFEGQFDGEQVCFEHAIWPSDLLGVYNSSYQYNNQNSLLSSELTVNSNQMNSNQTKLIAKWQITQGEQSVITDITIPANLIVSKFYRPVKFIDLWSHTIILDNQQIYSALKREQKLQKFTDELKKVFPDILGFDMIPYPDGSTAPVSVIMSGDKVLPLYACGDGVQRWFYILGIMILYKNSIICIDEIDTGLHYKAQAEFSVNLVDYALKNGVQLFVTTHNIEFVDAFLDAVNDKRNDKMDKIRIITLKDTVDGITSRTMNACEAVEVRGNYNLELR